MMEYQDYKDAMDRLYETNQEGREEAKKVIEELVNKQQPTQVRHAKDCLCGCPTCGFTLPYVPIKGIANYCWCCGQRIE